MCPHKARGAIVFYVQSKPNYKLIISTILIFVFNKPIKYLDHLSSNSGVIL